MTMILLGEVAPGGVGTGLYSILLFATLTVFIAGLMVGRTPEFLGKSIGAREVKLATLGVLVMPVGFLVSVGVSSVLHDGLAGPLNAGPHGFSEILYALASTWNNNGSAFAGLTAATNYYDYLLGAAMVFGRFLVILPALGLAGVAGGATHPAGLERQHADLLADLRRAPDRRDPAGRRSLLLPRSRSRPAERGPHREALVTTATTSLLEPTIARAALLDSFRKLDPRALLRNPVILSVWVVSVLVTGQLAVDIAQGHAVAFEAQIADLAVADRALRQLRRGARRGPRQGPGREPAQDAHARRSRACSAPATSRSRVRRPICAPATASSARRAT